MTLDAIEVGPATTDDAIENEIAQCLDPQAPKSFFLYAGAGSGKTRSLANALTAFSDKYGPQFRKSGRKVGVITYTNAACDEISSRVQEDPLFRISTIHSFCWSQISSFHADIQAWLKSVIPAEIAELEELQAKGRPGTKAALDRERSIKTKTGRLERLSVPRRFTYNPNGDNFGSDSLSHAEVLKIAANFIETKPSMQAVLVNRFPILLVDESQDTSRYLIDALFTLEAANTGKFALGLFGDMMQRIYADGKPDLGQNIPDRWAKPFKQMNHRSQRRIVQLGNTLRGPVDGQRQMARDDSAQGIARLFIAPAETPDKPALEQRVRKEMASIADDAGWAASGSAVKSLTLEHHMAASRMGFGELFAALDRDSRLQTGLRAGDLAGVRLFSERVQPPIDMAARDDRFATMALLRKESPLLKRSVVQAAEDPADPLAGVRLGVDALMNIDVADPATTFMDVLACVATHGLFEIPDSLKPFLEDIETEEEVVEADPEDADVQEDDAETSPASLPAWRAFLESPYRQIVPYKEYVTDVGAFGTHQGVKGLEFDRVLVIMDDSEARGFLFSYEKLFGAKQLSEGDRKRKDAGEDIGIDRTRRLLYVTCTRAIRSLALIAYTDAPDALWSAVEQHSWFNKAEIIRL